MCSSVSHSGLCGQVTAVASKELNKSYITNSTSDEVKGHGLTEKWRQPSGLMAHKHLQKPTAAEPTVLRD